MFGKPEECSSPWAVAMIFWTQVLNVFFCNSNCLIRLWGNGDGNDPCHRHQKYIWNSSFYITVVAFKFFETSRSSMLHIASKSFPVTVTVISHTVAPLLSTLKCVMADGMHRHSSVINFVAGKSKLLNVNLPRILKGRHISMTLNWYSFWWIIHPWSFDRIIQFNCNTWNKIIAGYWCMGTTPSKTKPTNSKIKNTMPKKTMTSFHQLFFYLKRVYLRQNLITTPTIMLWNCYQLHHQHYCCNSCSFINIVAVKSRTFSVNFLHLIDSSEPLVLIRDRKNGKSGR